MKKCNKCNGHKTILSMGGIRLKCEECKGIGFMIEAKPAPAIETKAVNAIHNEVTPVIKPNSKKVKVNSVKVEQANV